MGDALFRHNRIKKGRGIDYSASTFNFFRENQGQSLRFSLFCLSFFVLSLVPRSSYVYTIIARQPRISALNQAIPESSLSLNYPPISSSNFIAPRAADAPSAVAVVTCLTALVRQSPATKMPRAELSGTQSSPAVM